MSASRETGSGTICAVHCSVCEGMDHHWMYVGEENEHGEPLMSCKHCDATRLIEDDEE